MATTRTTSRTSSKAAPTDARTRRKDDRRRSIVEAAARRFAQLGYSECDMESVAAELGIAKGTLYLYFPGKQELFFACVDWGMAEMQRLVLAAADEAKPPLVRIGDAIGAYLRFFDEHPEYVELLIQERAIFRDRKKGTYFKHRDQIRPFFGRIYSQLVKQGVFRSDIPVERMLDTIGAVVYGTMFFNHAAGRSTPLDEQREALLQTVLNGLLVRK